MLLIREGLRRKLSESELAMCQFNQTIEHGRGRAKARRQVLLHTMKDFFKMIDLGDDTEDALDHHTIITFSVLTKAPMNWLFPAFAEAQVAEHFRLIGPGRSDLAKVLVLGVGGGPSLINDLALQGDQPTEFDPDDPAMVTLAFLADLGWTTPFANRVDQFNAVVINYTLLPRGDQKLVGQIFISCQQTQQAQTLMPYRFLCDDMQREGVKPSPDLDSGFFCYAPLHNKASCASRTSPSLKIGGQSYFQRIWYSIRTFRQLRKQVQPVSFEPAIKGTVVDPFEGEQDPNRDKFTGIQAGILPLVDFHQFVVYHTNESNDNLFGSHRIVLLLAVFCSWLKHCTTFLLSASKIGYIATSIRLLQWNIKNNRKTNHSSVLLEQFVCLHNRIKRQTTYA
jgi:hypothetical protein